MKTMACIGAALILASQPAYAASRNLNTGVTAPMTKVLPPTVIDPGPAVPLTTQECEGLGGAVKDTSTDNCSTGKMCARANQYGVIRTVCITAS